MPPKKKKANIDAVLATPNEIVNFYELPATKEFLHEYPNPNFEMNQIKVPAMCLSVGASGSGKTNFLCNLMSRFNDTFTNVYILNSGEEEPLYEMMKKKIKKGLSIVSKVSDMPSLEELGKEKDEQKLIVLDDMVGVKSAEPYIETLYKRGRKVGVTCVYLTQSFYNVPSFVRKQLHYLFLLKLSGKRDTNMIINNYALGVTAEQILALYKEATADQFNFLKIDIRTRDDNKKFSKNFTQYYSVVPEDPV